MKSFVTSQFGYCPLIWMYKIYYKILEKSQIWVDTEPCDQSFLKKSKFGNTSQKQVSQK